MRLLRLWLAGLFVASLAGCPEPSDPDIELYAFTSAPVARTATVRNQLDPPAYDITMTSGVAIGVSCWDSCDYYCVSPTVTSNDDSILRVRKVYRAGSTTTQFVLIAVAPGRAQVSVTNACAHRTYPVEVLAE